MNLRTKKTDPAIYGNLAHQDTKTARSRFQKDLILTVSRMLNEGKNPESVITNYIHNELLKLNPEIKRAMKDAWAGGVAYRFPDIDFQLQYGLIDPDIYNQILDQYEENLRMGTLTGDLSEDEERYHVLYTELTHTANSLMSYILETGKHKPLGIDWWVTLTPGRIKKLANFYISHDETVNIVFRALKLLAAEFGMPFNINPQVVYSLTGLDKRTVQRAIKKLTESHQDFKVQYWKKTFQYHVASLPKGKRAGREIQVSIPMQGEPNPDKWAVNQEQKHWQMLHELNTGRPPRYHNDPRAPLIYLRNGTIKIKLGTVSLIELFAIYTDYKPNSDFEYKWRASKIPMRRMDSYSYAVTDDFWQNKANCLTMQYLYEVQFPMQDRGLPLDIKQTERLIRRFEGYLAGTRKLPRTLLEKYGEGELKPEKKQVKSDEKITNRLRILRKIKKHYDPETERIYPTIVPRATASERAGTRWPNIQNLPKDLRHLLQNTREKLIMFDISGQENYLITEIRNFENMREINTMSDLATCIHERTGIDRKEVKTIAHALTKGKGLRTFEVEGNGEIARQVASEILTLEPRWGEHREARTEYRRKTHGRTEQTVLGQSGIIMDNRRADCQAVAIADQMQGAEQKKIWLCKLKGMLSVGCGIGIDMHDAVGIVAPQETEAVDIAAKVQTALDAANRQLGFSGTAKLTHTIYTDSITARQAGGRAGRYRANFKLKRTTQTYQKTAHVEEATATCKDLYPPDHDPRDRATSTRQDLYMPDPYIWVHCSGLCMQTSPKSLPKSLFPP
ncbi:hypothetical protein [Fidelibacter multiformis]|uniref:hypothetical protein n=1 Tax=Fidelibacter multiformis TaxID=3377529 RepID=UPI0037DCB311